MGFGSLAHLGGTMPLKALVEQLGGYGLDFVQLALAKAIGDIDTSNGKLSPGMANTIAEHFNRHGMRVGVLGCYIDMIHPDPVRRRHDLDRFKEHLRYARDFGTSIVATETSSLTTYRDSDPEAYLERGWQVLKQSVEELAEEAERWGVIVGIEPVAVHTVSSPQRMAQLLEEVPSNNIGVVFDPINLLTADNFAQRGQIVDDAFRLLRDRMVLVHLKDARVEGGQLIGGKPGDGDFDYAAFLKRLQQEKPHIDVSIENTGPDDIARIVNMLRAVV
ncbi:sugar phosphate isomerase/epimerase family protein [Paenibacillus chartarius]|uniref:Sugar phosphate isomerase/epimerase family protein n=1 Tax=Paenibacillus chartarius TaxID=747481 RepID=A0ABV6DLC5_9BACL